MPRVKVTSGGYFFSWFNEHIGEEFNVVENVDDPDVYLLTDYGSASRTVLIIPKICCVVVDPPGSSPDGSLLTSEENDIVQCLGAVWNKFLALPRMHEFDRREFSSGIHLLQNIVLSRPAAREILGSVRRDDEVIRGS